MIALTEKRFGAILLELVEENPFAIRAILRILETRFTTAVPTLAVTCEDRPRLLVNLGFLQRHCDSDLEVKAVVCHEFLHVILRHTETRQAFTRARHIALDAVINAIIHRQQGDAYSSMMGRFYADCRGIKKLLRPMNADERAEFARCADAGEALPQWVGAWDALYAGRLVADDIESLAGELQKQPRGHERRVFTLDPESLERDLLGDHAFLDRILSPELQAAIDEALRQMNGHGIWRAPKSRGVGSNPYEALFIAENEPMRRWERTALAVLRRHVTPDRKSRAKRPVDAEFRLPILSPQDRRAFLRSLWAPFIAEAAWSTTRMQREGTAQIYLDVSGSMNAEMAAIIALLGRLSRHIRRPFWAFSDVVAPARIEAGALKAETTGGTSMACVLRHIAVTRPECAVVVTDGYIETLDRADLAQLGSTRLHVLVTRDGNPSALARAGLPYTQLEGMPA